MSIKERFQKLVSNISMSSNQRDIMIWRHTQLIQGLVKNFYESSYIEDKRLLVGSYWKWTVIIPWSDIDVLFILPDLEFRETNVLLNVQSQILQKVKNKLSLHYTDKSQWDGQVIVINYSDWSKAEILPAFKLNDGTFLSLDTHNWWSYKLINPRREIDLINKSNNDTNWNTRKLIKIIKQRKEYCNVDIKSMVIEFMCVYFLNNYQYKNEDELYYDFMVRDFFEELLKYRNWSNKIPITWEKIHYWEWRYNKAQKAYEIAKEACNYESGKECTLATLERKKIFGDKFNF